MKKIIASVLFLVFASIFVPFISSQPSQIQAISPTITTSPTPVMMDTKDTKPKVEYLLPYPGILPTHPLYFLKNIRDQIVEMLISDPVKKADFYIIQADKKLSMALALADLKKQPEVQRALQDAERLRVKSVAQLESIKAAKLEVPGFVLDQLTRSLDKHIEVLTQLKSDKGVIQALIARSQKLVAGK
jgi:hypothetical protein